MEIGIPKEKGAQEHRVALTPSGVKTLVQSGARIVVESGAGHDAGYADGDYQSAGATTVYNRAEVFGRSELVVCIQPPGKVAREYLRPGHVVVANWALPAARPEDFNWLREREITAIGLEVIENEEGQAPVRMCMSEIAGRLALTVGPGLLLNEFGGRGILFSGSPGVPPASMVIIGAGVLGRAAAATALGLGAHVILLDRSVEHLRYACTHVGQSVPTMLATKPNIEKALSFADLVLVAAAQQGERAPLLITREMLKLMRPRSVIMDLSIDMGGCCETSRPTYFPNPTYEVDGIVHFCVPNLPSVAARSATLALPNALLPLLLEIVEKGFERAFAENRGLCRGTYLLRGACCKESLARMFGVPFAPPPCLAG
ncbi:MAG: alanine dehydrogenase [Thermoanaerobaculaceae bacterium]|nr:alanine dehydrogenase [Thermoanaerobaculaceae bacterium]